MRIDYIREYLVLVQEMNFTAAAKKLFLTQPALSRHIAALEDALGTRLLERTTHSVSLTAAGRAVIGNFENMSREYDKAVHAIHLLDDGYDNEFNIGLLLNSANKYTAPILEYMNEAFPKTRVRFSIVDVDELFKGTISGTYDVCMSLQSSFKGDDYLRFRTIKSVPLALMVPEGHRLGKKKSVPVSQIARETLVFSNDGDSYRANVLEKLAEFGVEPKATLGATQALSISKVCLGEGACAIVMEEMSLMNIPRCTFIPFDEEGMSMDLCWIYNALNPNPIIPQFIHGVVIEE